VGTGIDPVAIVVRLRVVVKLKSDDFSFTDAVRSDATNPSNSACRKNPCAIVFNNGLGTVLGLASD
jgi:hypothetical protein